MPATSSAVTCSAQATFLTGTLPREHGIVGNGWYFRDLAQGMFWRQSNQLVHGEKVWETARRRDPACTCAKIFWWFNMYSSADWSITPRPMYPADGRKVFDIYAWPYSVRTEIKQELGEFPFPAFWGPAAGLELTVSGPTLRFHRHATICLTGAPMAASVSASLKPATLR